MAGEDTFNPPVGPDYPVKESRAPRSRKTQYGDAYIERTRDGINSSPVQLSLSWTNLTSAEKDYFADFFEDKGSHEAFLYEPPTMSDPAKWTCETYDIQLVNADVWIVSAELTQVFDP